MHQYEPIPLFKSYAQHPLNLIKQSLILSKLFCNDDSRIYGMTLSIGKLPNPCHMSLYRVNEMPVIKILCLVNSVRPRYAIWRTRSGLTLAQVMTCCLTAPIHYPNQCWVIINKGQFSKRYLSHHSLKLAWKLSTQHQIDLFQGPMS